jgi:hypothetical protein
MAAENCPAGHAAHTLSRVALEAALLVSSSWPGRHAVTGWHRSASSVAA